ARTFEFSARGVHELVSDAGAFNSSRSSVIAAFVLRAPDRAIPHWLSQLVNQSPVLLDALVGAATEGNTASVRALMRLLPELAPATPEILPGLAGSIGDLA